MRGCGAVRMWIRGKRNRGKRLTMGEAKLYGSVVFEDNYCTFVYVIKRLLYGIIKKKIVEDIVT